ncbi:MAG: RluA family pseudouridine synthase [Myxococcota bacterium]
MSEALEPHGIRVLFADRDLILVHKPFGLASQAGRGGEPGVVELLRAAGFPTATLHHRLDQTASGVMALGLSEAANPGLATAFRRHTAQRTYQAVLGGPIVEQAAWNAPIEGKTALTHITRLGEGSGFSAVSVRLETGRTHQIRKHAAMAGVPIVGDRRYGGELGRAWPRLALHAASLTIPHPVRGELVHGVSPMPEELAPLWALAGGA